MRLMLPVWLAGIFVVSSLAQSTVDVGAGAPTSGVTLAFIYAWQRNGFSRLVGDPSGKVTKYGSTGLIQQFPSLGNTASTLALIKPDATDNPNVFQVLGSMYAYYTTVSVATAGYPTNDTLNCPQLKISGNSCQWQPFSNNYALFVYVSAPQAAGSLNFATRDPFYTKWVAFGGVSGLGPANAAETQFTSQFGSQATVQSYDQGAIYNITAGLYSGRLLAVKEPVYDLYVSNGGHTGPLGVPTSAELVIGNGIIQQTFERGAIQYDSSTGIAMLRPGVSRVSLTPIGSVHLNLGDTIQAQAGVYASDNTPLLDRTIAWSTSNGRIVQVQANGAAATLTAVGGGAATVTVTVEGKTSLPLNISVTAPCCQIGEGAPTPSIQQAFQDAVNRNKLNVQLPAASVAVRVGNGYVQQVVSAGPSPVAYLLAVPDGSVTGFVVTSAILSQYLALGGPAGTLGYPLADATAGGRQNFQQGALAGNPVQLVSGSILSKWKALGYETGVAGAPTAGAIPFFTFRGTAGLMQSFQNATIAAMTSGSLSGQAYVVTGAVLAKYTAALGPGGDLGAPTNDEHAANGLRQQDFEGGSVNYPAGGSTASVVLQPRQPLVTATPGTVLSGTPVHVVVGGFNNGATVRVSQTGQPDFVVQVASGAYAWDVRVPPAAPTGVVTVRAVDVNGPASAQGTYTVRNAATAPLTLSIVSGDRQNGAPGAQLSQPLVVLVQDQNGNPVPGQTVTFAASPGTQVAPASAVTGSNGQAAATLRLPRAEVLALATAQAAHQVVTFSARSAAFSLTNFPQLSQGVDGTLGNGTDTIRQKGALLTAVASILRYHQLRSELPQTNGLADPASLNQFLKSDGFISLPSIPEQTLNLWRAGAFVSNALDVRVEQSDPDAIRDLVAGGSPVLLALSLTGRGSHFVVAIGIAADGSILIADPLSAQTNLNGYLAQGTISGAARLLPQAPAAAGFLIAAAAAPAVSSVAGACGQTLSFPDTSGAAMLYFRACDGSAGPYQLDLAAPGDATLTDLSSNATQPVPGGGSLQILRSGAQWTLAPLAAAIAAGGIVNAASYSADIAPGGIVSIYGAGLSGATVQVNGKSASVLAATPFQVNAQVPPDIVPGTATFSASSKSGTAQQSVAIRNVAPAIFSVGVNQAAITNQDNALNTPSNPAMRGTSIVIYSTGFGAVSPSGKLSVATTPVSAVIGGTEIPAAFAGLTPGFIGLYQANVAVPANLPPGLSLPLYLKQGGAVSNTVTVAIQ